MYLYIPNTHQFFLHKGAILIIHGEVICHPNGPVNLLNSYCPLHIWLMKENDCLYFKSFCFGWLWSLCGETRHSANIALAALALQLTAILVMLFPSLCQQNCCLPNLYICAVKFCALQLYSERPLLQLSFSSAACGATELTQNPLVWIVHRQECHSSEKL